MFIYNGYGPKINYLSRVVPLCLQFQINVHLYPNLGLNFQLFVYVCFISEVM